MVTLVVCQNPRVLLCCGDLLFLSLFICIRSFYFVSLQCQTKTIIMSEVSKLKLEMLNGIEVNSLNYEGCVFIKGTKVFRNGEVIDELNTNKKINKIWKDYKLEEGF